MSQMDKLAGNSRCAALVLLLVAGCESTPDKSPPPPAARPSSSAASAAQPPASAAPSTSEHPSTPPPQSGAAFAGTWQGAYDAKKGSVTIPPSVKDKTHGADDGKVMTGPGKVE